LLNFSFSFSFHFPLSPKTLVLHFPFPGFFFFFLFKFVPFDQILNYHLLSAATCIWANDSFSLFLLSFF